MLALIIFDAIDHNVYLPVKVEDVRLRGLGDRHLAVDSIVSKQGLVVIFQDFGHQIIQGSKSTTAGTAAKPKLLTGLAFV